MAIGIIGSIKKATASVLLLLVILVFLTSCSTPPRNEVAPEIVAELVDGTPFKLSDLKGEFVLIHFWGSWCGPCLKENPMMVKLHKEYGDRVKFVSIALEKDDRMWKKVVEKHGMSWKHQIVDISPMLMASHFARAYGVTDIPATFLVDKEGKLVSQFHLPQIPQVLNAMLNETN